MIQKGACLATFDKEGNSALHLAAAHNTSLDVTNYLLRIGLDPYHPNVKFKVPYELASNEKIIRVLSVCILCRRLGSIKCKLCNKAYYCRIDCMVRDAANHKQRVCSEIRKPLSKGMMNHIKNDMLRKLQNELIQHKQSHAICSEARSTSIYQPPSTMAILDTRPCTNVTPTTHNKRHESQQVFTGLVSEVVSPAFKRKNTLIPNSREKVNSSLVNNNNDIF